MPKQLQDKLAQFQSLQNQVQMIAAQKQQIMLADAETENALKELEKAGEGRVYKAAGTLIIESTKDDSKKDLSESRESMQARIKVLETQEKKFREKFDSMRTEITGMLGQGHAHPHDKGG